MNLISGKCSFVQCEERNVRFVLQILTYFRYLYISYYSLFINPIQVIRLVIFKVFSHFIHLLLSTPDSTASSKIQSDLFNLS